MASSEVPRQSFDVSGHHNKVKKVKQKICLHSPTVPAGPPPPVYRTKWSLVSPLTQGRLALLSAVLGVLALIEGYAGFKPLIDGAIHHKPGWLGHLGSPNPVPLFVAFGGVCGLAGTMYMRYIVKNRLQILPNNPVLPVRMAVRGRFALARFTGRCTICGGKLCFYNVPTDGYDIVSTERPTKHVVTARQMRAECRLNKNHCWSVDPTEPRTTAS